VLGQGEQWAAVAGFDGSVMVEDNPSNVNTNRSNHGDNDKTPTKMRSDHGFSIPTSAPPSTPRMVRRRLPNRQDSSAANVMVKKNPGGGIFVDDPSFLTEWSVEAIALVRRQLTRAARGAFAIPYEENWIEDEFHSLLDENAGDDDQERLIVQPQKEDSGDEDVMMLPVWVSEVGGSATVNGDLAASDGSAEVPGLVVTDLPLMVDEVSELLYKMEDIMMAQRRRRLDLLQPPGWLRRNWYIMAGVAPPVSYILIKMMYNGYGKSAVKFLVERISTFFRERVKEPVVAM